MAAPFRPGAAPAPSVPAALMASRHRYIKAEQRFAALVAKVAAGHTRLSTERPAHWIISGHDVLFGSAQIQTSKPLQDGAEVVVYRSKADGRVWVRRTAEMDDGRFEPADAAGAPEPPSASAPIQILYSEHGGPPTVRTILLTMPRGEMSFDSGGWGFPALDVEAGEWRRFLMSGLRAWGEEAVNALLAVVRSSGEGEKNTSGRDPDGSGSRASIEPANAVSPASGGVDPSRNNTRDQSLTNADRLIIFACFHADKLGPALAAELEEFAAEWVDEVETLRARDEQPKAENPKGLSPQGASPIDEVEAPASKDQGPSPQAEIDRLRHNADQWRDLARDNAAAADRLARENADLRTALAESERKRVEAEADLADEIATRDFLGRRKIDRAAVWVENPTPTQETPDDQG